MPERPTAVLVSVQATGSEATTRAARSAAMATASRPADAQQVVGLLAGEHARPVGVAARRSTRTIGPQRRCGPKRVCVHSGAKSLASTCASWAKNGPGVDASARTPATPAATKRSSHSAAGRLPSASASSAASVGVVGGAGVGGRRSGVVGEVGPVERRPAAAATRRRSSTARNSQPSAVR